MLSDDFDNVCKKPVIIDFFIFSCKISGSSHIVHFVEVIGIIAVLVGCLLVTKQ